MEAFLIFKRDHLLFQFNSLMCLVTAESGLHFTGRNEAEMGLLVVVVEEGVGGLGGLINNLIVHCSQWPLTADEVPVRGFVSRMLLTTYKCVKYLLVFL